MSRPNRWRRRKNKNKDVEGEKMREPQQDRAQKEK